MKTWKDALVRPNTSIRKVIEAIDSVELQIALVTDRQRHLLGTVTDGDIRRGILKGISLESPVKLIMNPKPVTIREADENRELILKKMKERQIHQLPVLDLKGQVVGLEMIRDLILSAERPNLAVLMAGGLGTRLQPLTNDCPKPLIKIGGKPILENILESLVDFGIRKFFISVNYKSEMIRKHFGDGTRWNVNIRYLEENMKMGTAGALSLLPVKPREPLIVMNADLLTKVNFQHLFDFHHEHNADLTTCVREYDIQVPFGVVKLDDHQIRGIDEKPVQRFFVNAGIYLLQPRVLKYLKKGVALDMPQLIERLKSKYKVLAFPIREYWIDVGKMDDLQRASEDIDSLSK